MTHRGKDFSQAHGLQKERFVSTLCGMCGPGPACGIYALVSEGRFIGVEGMKEAPLNRGKLCPKAHAAPQWVYSPQRLQYPLKRAGARGEGKFKRIGWDEALNIIADKLKEQKKEFGPESLAILSPARRTYNMYFSRFLSAHGSPNYAHSGICAVQNAFSFLYTLGTGFPQADYENSKLIIIWGKQPVYAGSSRGGTRALVKAKESGATIISIKPTMEPDAALANIWVPIRPGTDAALGLAMLNVIITGKLYDSAFVSEWCYGFEALERHIQNYTPDWAEPITGLPALQIKEIAELYARTKPAAIDAGNGLEHAPSASHAARSVAILMAITGNFDRPGGNISPAGSTMPRPIPIGLTKPASPNLIEKLVAPEFPKPFQPVMGMPTSAYYPVFESVLTEKPYPVKTIIAPGTQPTVSTRGTKRVIEALKKVDFFVVIDVMQTAEMDFADLVVPVSTTYESDHPFELTQNWIIAPGKVIEPLGDYKSMYEFWLELGMAMGYGDDFWNGNMEDCLNYQLKPFNLTMKELRAHPTGIVYPMKPMKYEKYQRIFATRSFRPSGPPYLPQGKVALYNTTFEEHGFSPLPTWKEPPEGPTSTPELLERYPLIFSDFHTSKAYTASWLRNVPLLREIMPEPTLQIHPETARERGIGKGDWVIVESSHGSVRLKAEVIPGIRPDTVMALHGWWQGCEELDLPGYGLLEGGANTNSMYSVDPERVYDPLVTGMSSQTLVQVKKA